MPYFTLTPCNPNYCVYSTIPVILNIEINRGRNKWCRCSKIEIFRQNQGKGSSLFSVTHVLQLSPTTTEVEWHMLYSTKEGAPLLLFLAVPLFCSWAPSTTIQSLSKKRHLWDKSSTKGGFLHVYSLVIDSKRASRSCNTLLWTTKKPKLYKQRKTEIFSRFLGHNLGWN